MGFVMAAWADECTGFNHMHCRQMNNSFIYSLFCSFKYSFYYYTLGPILSTEESVVNKDELKFLPYGSKSCERESINWMTLETQIIWISSGDTRHKGEVLRNVLEEAQRAKGIEKGWCGWVSGREGTVVPVKERGWAGTDNQDLEAMLRKDFK